MTKITRFVLVLVLVLVPVLVLVLICGCTDEPSDDLRVEWKYQVLIGTKSVPDYDSVVVGDSFDIDGRLMVFGGDDVGSVNVYKDGILMSTYRKGMILFMGDSGAFLIEGESRFELFVYILEKFDGDKDIVVMKDKIPPGLIKGVRFSIPD